MEYIFLRTTIKIIVIKNKKIDIFAIAGTINIFKHIF
jgi:hypothetical protein